MEVLIFGILRYLFHDLIISLFKHMQSQYRVPESYNRYLLCKDRKFQNRVFLKLL